MAASKDADDELKPLSLHGTTPRDALRAAMEAPRQGRREARTEEVRLLIAVLLIAAAGSFLWFWLIVVLFLF